MKLLTIDDLMKRWQVSRRTINTYMKNGIITKVPGLDCVRFNPKQIELVEGKTEERKTWKQIELEEENNSLKAEIDRLNNIIGQVIGNLSNVWRG
ncbi:histidine kinase [Clostridium senegalense]